MTATLAFIIGLWIGSAYGYLVGMGRWRTPGPTRSEGNKQ